MGITIVTYHYVREIQNSSYPKIRGLEFSGFQRQLDYLSKKYQIISANDLIEYIRGGNSTLPENSCLLTFDDGFKDHVENVVPELKRRGLTGCFFPTAGPIVEERVLDVHAIHFILACCDNITTLVSDLKDECRKVGFTESDIADLWANAALANRFDPGEVIFVKRLLQRDLPEEFRSSITKTLFERYVGKSQNEFSRELYMSQSDVKDLVTHGMYVGSHGYYHYFLDSIDARKQELEIDRSLQFLSDVGASTSDWIMCYPYGAYDYRTLDILVNRKCIAGVTTKAGIASLDSENALELSRFDTTDFPQ